MKVEGQPDYLFRRGINWIGLYPHSANDSGHIKLAGTALPDVMVQLTDVPGFPVPFHTALVEYALFELKAQDHEPEQAIKHWESYLDYEAGLLNHMLTRTALDQQHQIGTL